MTLTAPSAPSAPADLYAGLSAAAAERLERLLPHLSGKSAAEMTRMVDEGFRNFAGVNTDRLVAALTA